jgi:hypothetical protein
MAYLVRVTEWCEGGREFLVTYRHLPPILAQSIEAAEPVSLRKLVCESCDTWDTLKAQPHSEVPVDSE